MTRSIKPRVGLNPWVIGLYIRPYIRIKTVLVLSFFVKSSVNIFVKDLQSTSVGHGFCKTYFHEHIRPKDHMTT